jgi:PAS domain-containing protein
MDRQITPQEKAPNFLFLTQPNWSELLLFGVLAGLGAVASYFSVNIPYTEVYIEGRWAFGFMGFALLRRWWAALLLACLLSVTGFHQVPVTVYLPANLLYVIPCLITIRLVHARFLSRFRHLALYGIGWLLLVLACYQLFSTPLIWAVLATLRDKPIWPAVLAGWQEQPFLVESVLVGIVSALGMTVVRSYQALHQSRQELATTFDSIGDGVIVTDAQGRVTRMNPVAQTLTGWSLAEAQGRPLEEIFRLVNA